MNKNIKEIRNKKELSIRSSAAEYLTYVASIGDHEDSIEVRYEDENIWLTQKMMATLYDVSVSAINQHIEKIYDDVELEQISTIKKFLIVQEEGNRKVNREVVHYNLQMIIAVGFKVNNERAERHIPMTMEDWSKRLDLFLLADDREILQDAGSITAEIAKTKAETEFEKYRIIQDRLFMSDYDKYLLELEKKTEQ